MSENALAKIQLQPTISLPFKLATPLTSFSVTKVGLSHLSGTKLHDMRQSVTGQSHTSQPVRVLWLHGNCKM
ncbi:hypothetical protein AcW1_001589 [Taiwanofungus camphoratus]|nr:hypothetical protein AcW1_001589 [Antrodia cinnamomea]